MRGFTPGLRKGLSMLKERVLSALVLIPIVLAASYFGGPYFATAVSVCALLAVHEFYEIMAKAGYRTFPLVGLGLAAVLLADAYWPHLGAWRWAMTAAIALPMVWQIMQPDAQGFLTGWALTLAGAAYVGCLFGHLISVRSLPQGLGWLLLTFAGTWACDTAAYFVGVRWGRRGFFTHVSPHKTLEGAVGGVAASMLATLIAGHFLGLDLLRGFILGIILAVGVTFGDLAESLVKRQVGVKDSGNLIPGHGGMLDRIDSLTFAGVIVYYFVKWMVVR